MKSESNILIFKAAPEERTTKNLKDPYQEQLENLVLSVKVINTLDFNYTNIDELRKKLENPDNYSALVFGSPRCVHAVTKAVGNLDSRWKNLPAFAVGETTGRLVYDKLGLNAEGTNSGHGAALAPLVLQRDLHRPVLMPCGNLSRDTISKILQDNGISTDVVQVYETVTHVDLESNLKKAIADLTFNIIIYFSPSGISATLPFLQKYSVPLKEIKFVAIGPTTEKALEELGFRVSAVASKPTPESLASAVSQILT